MIDRKYRKQVMQETLRALKEGVYQSASGRRVALDVSAIEAHARRGRLIPEVSEVGKGGRPVGGAPAQIEVVEGDCLLAALGLKNGGLNPACLNMASSRHPGGGYLEGAGAQEENLFRRTAYHCFIGNDSPWRPPEIGYPLPEFAGIYSPEVAVLRGQESEHYPFLDEPRAMSFIAVAAYFSPPLDGNRLTPEYADNTRRKIRLIFDIGIACGHDALVLSALGCGAYRNPPAHLAELFREVLAEGYGRSFKRIVFAIIDDHNAVREGSTEGNLRPFQRVLDGLRPG